MRQLFSILFLLSSCFLAAQIQVLPDMEVTGESQVRIFLYKKALPYSQQDAKSDSLSAFLPTTSSITLDHKKLKTSEPKRAYAQLDGSTDLYVNGYLRYQPKSKTVQSIGLKINSANPEKNYSAQQTNLMADLSLSPSATMCLHLPLYTAQADSFGSEYYGAGADLRNRDFQVFSRTVKFQNTGLRAYKLWQQNQTNKIDRKAVSLKHSHEVEFGKILMGNMLLLNDGVLGFHHYTQYDVLPVEESRIHLLYNKHKIIPSIGFRYRNLLDFDTEIRIQNLPELTHHDYPEMMESKRWVNFLSPPKNTLVPWNMKIIGEKHFTANPERKLKSIGMELKSVWKTDDPILLSGTNDKAPDYGYVDAMYHSILFKADLRENEVDYSQSLSVNMAHASDENWQILPYNPILNIESTAKFSLNLYELDVALKQHYFSIDEYGRDLPEFIDFNIGLGYQLGAFSKLRIEAENLLNSRHIIHRNLPERGLSISATVSHHF